MTRPETHAARRLRGDMPPAERILWARLRRSAIGHRLRRQHPIGPYIADFRCLAAKVVVEVDGGSHFDEAGLVYDQRRDAYIQSAGFQIVRVTNVEVKRELDGVLLAIRTACDEAMRSKQGR